MGVFTCFDIRNDSEGDILENLKRKNNTITDVKRIKVRRGKDLVNTNTYIATFSTALHPSEISIAYLKVKVRTYIPNPMRCFKCNRFGHTKQFCKSAATCAKCTSLEHSSEDCSSNRPLCINCRESHAAYSKECCKWKEEKEILTIKVKNNISFAEARKQYRLAHPLQKSFAAVVRSQPTPTETSCKLSEAELKNPSSQNRI